MTFNHVYHARPTGFEIHIISLFSKWYLILIQDMKSKVPIEIVQSLILHLVTFVMEPGPKKKKPNWRLEKIVSLNVYKYGLVTQSDWINRERIRTELKKKNRYGVSIMKIK